VATQRVRIGHPPKLLDRVRLAARRRHMSYRTEQSYVGWVRRFVMFHDVRHPKDMGTGEIEAFLSHLAIERNVSAATQNQAYAALVFLYRHVLDRELEGLERIVRARRSRPAPVVLSRDEVARVLARLHGTKRLQATLLYGAGMRLI
jgi:site-specific recombinase XerD